MWSYIYVDPLVAFQVAFLCEAFTTGQTTVRPLSCMYAPVGFEVAQFSKTATAQRTAERPLTCVCLQVGLQVTGVREALATLATAQDVPGTRVEVRVYMRKGARVEGI